jgi:SAM-dependent methyltransferase
MIGIFLLTLIALTIVIWTQINGISPMPTAPKVKRRLFGVLPKDIEGPIFELGCGFGTLMIPLSKRYSNNNVIGFETSPFPYLVSKMIALFHPNMSVKWQNFYNISLDEAGLIVCYLYPGAMEKLEEKFEELKPGTYFVTHTFSLPNTEPMRVYEVEDLYRTKIYLYQREKADG